MAANSDMDDIILEKDHFDVIVCGTGLPEAILASAFARAGKSIIHIDPSDVYGCQWGSLSLSQMCDLFGKSLKLSSLPFDEEDLHQELKAAMTHDQFEECSSESLRCVPFVQDWCLGGVKVPSDTFLVLEEYRKKKQEIAEEKKRKMKRIYQPPANQEKMTSDSGQEKREGEEPICQDEMTCDSGQEISKRREPTDQEEMVSTSNQKKIEREELEMDEETHNSESKREVSSPHDVFEESPEPTRLSFSDLLTYDRQFSIDICPKFIFSTSDVVELIIRTNLGQHYLVFRGLNGTYLSWNNIPCEVPISKQELFQSTLISMKEKRALGKLLQMISSYIISEKQKKSISNPQLTTPPLHSLKVDDEQLLRDSMDQPFNVFLNKLGMSDFLKSIVLYNIALFDYESGSCCSYADDVSTTTTSRSLLTRDAISNLSIYLVSLGRYHHGALLYCQYGLGELSQAYCRLCAVYGGIYLLRFSPKFWILEDKSINQYVKGMMTSNKQYITCDWLVINSDFGSHWINHTKTRLVSRCICITDKPINGAKDDTLLLTIPPSSQCPAAIRVFQFHSSVEVCPHPYYIVHLSVIHQNSPESDLKSTVESLFCTNNSFDIQDDRPYLIWNAYFFQRIRFPSSTVPKNIIITPDPSAIPECGGFIKQLEDAFHVACPNEVFLPTGSPHQPEEKRTVQDELDDLDDLDDEEDI